MAIHRPGPFSIALLSMAAIAFRPGPSLAQAGNDPQQQQQQQNANTCGLQRLAVLNRDCIPPPAAEPERVRVERDRGPLGVIIALAVGVLAILVAKALTGDKNHTVNDLAEDGPKAPERELLGQYEVQGLIYPNWPLVVEVASDPDATTFVQIVPAKDKNAVPPMVISESGGAPWGDRIVLRPVEVEQTERGVLAKFELPGDLGRGSEEGWHSARLSVLSGRMEGDEFHYRPLDVLALGAGPSAVGSAVLQITRFETAPQLRRASFTVRWNARRRFENVDAELVQRTRSARAVTRKVQSTQDICLTPEERDLCVSGPSSPLPYQRQGEWPATAGGQLDAGRSYHMQLRAWTGRNATGGWIIDQAPGTIGW